MSSDASSLILLLEILNTVRLEVFCKAFAILIAPVDCKLFPLIDTCTDVVVQYYTKENSGNVM